MTASAAEAAETFRAVDPDAPMWAWGADQHARFWVRRMLFETLVHRTGAETAVGIRPTVDRGAGGRRRARVPGEPPLRGVLRSRGGPSPWPGRDPAFPLHRQ
ncbi:maleylpyruvate isomerase N-terminal domain-containing protein [Streptomyces sp. NPDC091266]|uniref:maleylpyruvate isomerase N-terminal domain-containing protein n=1 Tax=Streptomyces sp. NPDC091266 TaxID=3365978 RepID=UPI0037FBA8A4